MNTRVQPKPVGLVKPVSPIGFFGERSHVIEKARVSAQVRLTHLKNQGRQDPDTTELVKRTKDLENWVDGRLASLAASHPTYAWWSRITGCSPRLVGSIIGHIENFGRFYPVDDPMIPKFVDRTACLDDDNEPWIWVEGIERLPTPSALYKLAALAPGMRRTAGQLSEGNIELKTACFRLFQFGFLFRGGPYRDFYQGYKERKERDFVAQGGRVMATPKGRFCPQCAEERHVPRTTLYCPDCGTKLASKIEPEGVLFKGHLDAMARRRAMKLFLSHLWLVWRQALNLPVCQPYALDMMPDEHQTFIDPWSMCDKPSVAKPNS